MTGEDPVSVGDSNTSAMAVFTCDAGTKTASPPSRTHDQGVGRSQINEYISFEGLSTEEN
jgi:hypothetical protein